MADRVTRIRPGPVFCPLGGAAYPVHEARLADLLELQAWVDARWPDPAEGLDDALRAAESPEDRDRVLFAYHDAIEDGPPCFDDARGADFLFGSPGGFAAFLWVALTRGTPGLTAATVDALAARVESGDREALAWFRAVQAAFYGADPLRRVAAMLGLADDRPRGEPITWGEAIDGLARSHGWTYPEVYALSVSEFLNARRGGKPHEYHVSPATAQAFLARKAAVYGGEPPEPEEVTEAWPGGW